MREKLKGIIFYKNGKRLDKTTFNNFPHLYNNADKVIFKDVEYKRFCYEYFGMCSINKDLEDVEECNDCLCYIVNDDLHCWQENY